MIAVSGKNKDVDLELSPFIYCGSDPALAST